MTVEHRTLTFDREYPHAPERVFAAWADPAVKVRWFDLSDSPDPDWQSDFRVGGLERYVTSRAAGSPQVTYEGRYCDIVDRERIVLTVQMSVDGRLSSMTVSTVEFEATWLGTRIRLTDQAVFLDGLEVPDARGSGVGTQLDRLAALLDHAT